MRRFAALVGLSLCVSLAACAQPGSPDDPAGPPDQREEAFRQRATEVAEAWRTAALPDAWRSGYVPLQEPTILPADPGFDDDTKQAFVAGWYRSEVPLPKEKPSGGTIHFPDGTLDVPLVSAAQAYAQLDQGDPPPCPGRPTAPTTPPAQPDSPDNTDSAVVTACVPLTVTKVTLGTATVRTSRGDAKVPAWLFTIAELNGPLARVAVDPAATTAVPEVPVPAGEQADGLVAALALTAIEGTQLSFRLGVGACDTEITPLVQESDTLVVVGGTVVRAEGTCTDQLVLEPVTASLNKPLGARLLLDAVTGQPLTLSAVG